MPFGAEYGEEYGWVLPADPPVQFEARVVPVRMQARVKATPRTTARVHSSRMQAQAAARLGSRI